MKNEEVVTSLASANAAFPAYRTRSARQPDQPRYIVAKRLNSVRLNWFMFGALFGMTLCFLFNAMTQQLFVVASAPKSEKPTLTAKAKAPAKVAAKAKPAAVPTQTAEAPAAEEPTEKQEKGPVAHTMKSGETLAEILTDHGLDYAKAHDAIQALKKTYNPRNLRAGQKLTLDVAAGELKSLEIATSPIRSVKLTRSDAGTYQAAKHEEALSPELTFAGGTIVSSLFETGYEHGIPDGVLAELVQAYSYDVDFQREIQRGDHMEVLFEKMLTEDGDEAGYGDIIYATLKLRGKPISIYRFEDKHGHSGFYNEKGESVIKALLKTPINGARISSNYGMRKHPILGFNKMHKGTDFAAPTGTPIYAAGEATVVFVGRKGGYGNYIKLKHNGTYSTAYAHLHRYAKGMRKGKKVKQGQVIGYVGSTGRSTGPHLHYEVHKNGRQVNPMREKFKTGKVLKGTELANFKQSMTKIKRKVANMPRGRTKMAKAELDD